MNKLEKVQKTYERKIRKVQKQILMNGKSTSSRKEIIFRKKQKELNYWKQKLACHENSNY